MLLCDNLLRSPHNIAMSSRTEPEHRRRRARVLVLYDWYPPAFRAGGPTRSIPALVGRYGRDYRFIVITGDRDIGCSEPLAGVSAGRWLRRGKAGCVYLSPWRRRLGGLYQTMRATRYDTIYLNSVFSVDFTLLPLLLRRAGLVPRTRIVIAPRGSLNPGAMAIKSRQKRLYLTVIKMLGLVSDTVWHASTADEAQAITAVQGPGTKIVVVPPIIMQPRTSGQRSLKVPGSLSIAFVGRISPIKNLDFAISLLAKVQGSLTFNVHGPIEDRRYWETCLRNAASSSDGIRVVYAGPIGPDDLGAVLERHHVLFLPSLGESYSHAIVEALLAGVPVLISDRTPWHKLAERRAGWDIPLEEPDLFVATLQELVTMGDDEWRVWSEGARALGREAAESPEVDEAHHRMFRAALGEAF